MLKNPFKFYDFKWRMVEVTNHPGQYHIIRGPGISSSSYEELAHDLPKDKAEWLIDVLNTSTPTKYALAMAEAREWILRGALRDMIVKGEGCITGRDEECTPQCCRYGEAKGVLEQTTTDSALRSICMSIAERAVWVGVALARNASKPNEIRDHLISLIEEVLKINQWPIHT